MKVTSEDLLLIVLIICVTILFIFPARVFNQPTCQSEFNQQVKSTSVEHGQDIPHKGRRPNRIVIECEGK